MHPLRKEPLTIDPSDSAALQKLKSACNELIALYNQLSNPMQEEGQQLVSEISMHVMKLHQLKEVHFDKRR